LCVKFLSDAVSDAYLGMNFDRYPFIPRKLLTASFNSDDFASFTAFTFLFPSFYLRAFATFSTPRGNMRPMRVVFGAKCSQDLFDEHMYRIFGDLNSLHVPI
jgi:hypothetical protein